MTTYRLITEQELQQAIDALKVYARHALDANDCHVCAAEAVLRAVQEREGPKERGYLHKDHVKTMLYSTAGTAWDLSNGDHALYTLPEEPK